MRRFFGYLVKVKVGCEARRKIDICLVDDNNIIIIELDDSDGIPQEMTGLVAMAVVSKYHKPVMIGRRNSKDEIQGSLRSDGNFEGLPSFKKFLEESALINYAAGQIIMALNTFSSYRWGHISG